MGSHRSLLGDILHAAGRSPDAEPHYHAILDDPASSAHDRYLAYHGLVWCALDRDDPDPNAARRHALAAAHRAAGDLDAAWDAATRYMDAAGRVGDHVRLFYATRAAVDIALDRKDLDSARRLLADLDPHADALDAGTTPPTSTTSAPAPVRSPCPLGTCEVRRRRRRVADVHLTPKPRDRAARAGPPRNCRYPSQRRPFLRTSCKNLCTGRE